VHERGEGGYKEAGGATEGVHASKTLVRTWTGGGGGGSDLEDAALHGTDSTAVLFPELS